MYTNSANACRERSQPRVLHYLCNPVRAGVEEHALSIVTVLGRYGFVPYIAARAELLKMMERELVDAGVRMIPAHISSPLDVRGRLRLAAELKRERIDLFHGHMFDATLLAVPAARLAGTPRVVETNHGAEVWRQNKLLKRSFWIDRQLARLVDRFIAVSHAAGEHLCKKKGIPASKIAVIHNGRDLTRYAPATVAERHTARAELGLGDRKVLLTVGRLDEQKGHVFLIRALAELRDRWPSLIALFAGAGPLENRLRAQCNSAGLADRIRFLGYSPAPEKLLAAADVGVLPSLWEGLPLVAIETLAAARPMVATAIPGTAEVIIDDVTGLLVPPGDHQSLAQAIERLLRDPDLAQRLARDGQDFVKRHFDISQQIERTVALYRDLLETKTLSA